LKITYKIDAIFGDLAIRESLHKKVGYMLLNLSPRYISMIELQFFVQKGVMIVEFDNTKLVKKIWKISKTLMGNPSDDIVDCIK
jgi:hypothetical protein